MSPLEAREKFNAALQEYVTATYGKDMWAGDYFVSAVILDMREGAHPDAIEYMHIGKGPAHSQRGLLEEANDYLIDLREEEKSAAENDADGE